jgi:hypothetical protein
MIRTHVRGLHMQIPEKSETHSTEPFALTWDLDAYLARTLYSGLFARVDDALPDFRMAEPERILDGHEVACGIPSLCREQDAGPPHDQKPPGAVWGRKDRHQVAGLSVAAPAESVKRGSSLVNRRVVASTCRTTGGMDWLNNSAMRKNRELTSSATNTA